MFKAMALFGGWLQLFLWYLFTPVLADNPRLDTNVGALMPVGLVVIMALMFFSLSKQTLKIVKKNPQGKGWLLSLVPWLTTIFFFFILMLGVGALSQAGTSGSDGKTAAYIWSSVIYIVPLILAGLTQYSLTKK